MDDECQENLIPATVEEITAIKEYEFAAAKKKENSSVCVVHAENLD